MTTIPRLFFCDDFHDNTQDTERWQLLQNGATASETNQRLQVTVPSGSGWAQAGYVTSNFFRLYEHIIRVNVPSCGNLNEMTLQICTSQTTNQDPSSQSNWYRIMKTNANSFLVQRKIAGGNPESLQTFTSSSQQLVIKIQDGFIEFYDDSYCPVNNVKHREAYAIKDGANQTDYNCYVYVFTSSQRSGVSGIGYFDDFAISPVTRAMSENDARHDFNCFTGSSLHGGRGTTIWGPVDIVNPVSHGGGVSPGLIFTPTQPKGYFGKDFCCVTFTVHAESSSISNDVIGGVVMSIWKEVQNPPLPPNWVLVNSEPPTFISKIGGTGGHDVTLTVDLAPMQDYDDTKRMYLSFTNGDPQVDVSIKNVQIVRSYAMHPLNQLSGCPEDQSLSAERDYAARHDYPCNYDTCGGVSYTGFAHDNTYFQQIVAGNTNNNQPDGTILLRGETYHWTWTNPTATFAGFNNNTNYLSKAHCLFNFNNVGLCDDSGNELSLTVASDTQDVPFKVRINTSDWVTLYHSRKNYHLAHSIDLATHEYLSTFYKDEPGETNMLYLTIPNNPNPEVNLFLADGETGLVNIYRVYNTKPCCPSITSASTEGGSISPSGGPFPIPQSGKIFNIQANSGNYLNNLTVDDASKGAINPYTVHWDVPNTNIDLNRNMDGHSIEADFGPKHNIYAYVNGEGGSISPNGNSTVVHGSTPSYTITAWDCYQIASITVNGGAPIVPGYSPYTYQFSPVQADQTIVAEFSVGGWPYHRPVEVEAQIDNVVQLTVDNANYSVSTGEKAKLCLTITEPHIYLAPQSVLSLYFQAEIPFYRWNIFSGNQYLGSQYSNPMAFKHSDPISIQAQYDPSGASTCTISVSSGAGGTISPNGTVTVCSGGNATFYMIPQDGHILSDLLLNGNSVIANVSNNQYTSNFSSNATLYAVFSSITRIQAASHSVASSNPNQVTLPSQPTQGNKLIAVVGHCSPASIYTYGISQTGVTWNLVARARSDNNVATAEIWIGTVGANASQTLTVIATSTSYYHVCHVAEYAGLAASPLDQTATNNSHSNTVDSGTTAQTTQANELWVGALCGTSGSCGLSNPTNNFAMLSGTGELYSSIELGYMERAVNSVGYANVSASTCGWPAWAGCVATFKAST